MKASFDGTSVLTGRDGRVLYDQSGYGRPEGDGVRLAPQEALYLLHRKRIEIPGYTFDTLLYEYANQRNFLRSFLVYRDLRERGYVVQTGSSTIFGYSGAVKNRVPVSRFTLSASSRSENRSGLRI